MTEKAKHEAPDLNKVANRWSKYETNRNSTGFYNSSILRPYFIEMAYGQEYVDEYKDNPFAAEDLFIKTYLPGKNVQSILSICCGYGEIERHFVKRLDGVKHCLGVDIAQGALQVAKERSIAEGLDCIRYECADLNCYPWPKEEYDLVISNGALHHLGNLESVVAGIRQALKPGGILYACEYVGPSYKDHAPRQLELINACAFLVPPELRARRGILIPQKFTRTIRFLSKMYAAANSKEQPWWSDWKKKLAGLLRMVLGYSKYSFDYGVVYVSPKAYLLRTDPSECIRSADIIPVVKSVFQSAEILPFGGGILQHALDNNFYDKFETSNPKHLKARSILCQLEKGLMDMNELSIENAFIVARK